MACENAATFQRTRTKRGKTAWRRDGSSCQPCSMGSGQPQASAPGRGPARQLGQGQRSARRRAAGSPARPTICMLTSLTSFPAVTPLPSDPSPTNPFVTVVPPPPPPARPRAHARVTRCGCRGISPHYSHLQGSAATQRLSLPRTRTFRLGVTPRPPSLRPGHVHRGGGESGDPGPGRDIN